MSPVDPLEEPRTKLADLLRDKLQEHAKDTWEQLDTLVKLEIREALEDLAELTLLHATGVDVSRETAHARARLANWSFVGSDIVRDKVKIVLRELAELLGGFLRGIVK